MRGKFVLINRACELKGQFNMRCQWRAICVWVWTKQGCMKFGFELKGQFNAGRQWRGVVSGMTLQIIRDVPINEGQIIRAKLYVEWNETNRWHFEISNTCRRTIFFANLPKLFVMGERLSNESLCVYFGFLCIKSSTYWRIKMIHIPVHHA